MVRCSTNFDTHLGILINFNKYLWLVWFQFLWIVMQHICLQWTFIENMHQSQILLFCIWVFELETTRKAHCNQPKRHPLTSVDFLLLFPRCINLILQSEHCSYLLGTTLTVGWIFVAHIVSYAKTMCSISKLLKISWKKTKQNKKTNKQTKKTMSKTILWE